MAATDIALPSAGNDSTSSLSWSPTANILVASNWDAGIRCWEVQQQGAQMAATPKAQGTSRVVGAAAAAPTTASAAVCSRKGSSLVLRS
jgi:hypothetical protein